MMSSGNDDAAVAAAAPLKGQSLPPPGPGFIAIRFTIRIANQPGSTSGAPVCPKLPSPFILGLRPVEQRDEKKRTQ